MPFQRNPLCQDDSFGVTKRTEPRRAQGQAGGGPGPAPEGSADAGQRGAPLPDGGSRGPDVFRRPDVFTHMKEDFRWNEHEVYRKQSK